MTQGSPKGLGAGELTRKVLHVAMGGFAFLLRDLTWPEAASLALLAFVFNWQVLPRAGGRYLWRNQDRDKGYPLGILLYPLAVLALILAFRHELWKAAGLWGLLAFGDGMASLVGLALGGPRLPWNPRKSVLGFMAFWLFGAAFAWVLFSFTRGGPFLSPQLLWLSVLVALLGAVVESLPTTLDDNLTVPLVTGLFVALVADLNAGALLRDDRTPGRVALGALLNGGFAILAILARSIDLPGACSAVVVGTAIMVGLGGPGLLTMVAFFVVGTAVTKLGFGRKLKRGIAQEKGGARGWRNVWANGGVAALLAVVAGIVETGGGQSPEVQGLLLSIAYAAAVATAAADTCSSEIGKAYGSRTFLITTLRPALPGTEGGVSLEGTLGGLAGAMVIAAVGALAGLYTWPASAVVALSGLLGSLAESLLGTVAERRGWLDNDMLNALNTAIGAGLAVCIWAGRGMLT